MKIEISVNRCYHCDKEGEASARSGGGVILFLFSKVINVHIL